MKQIVCHVCGATKKVNKSNVGKYCSRACKSADARKLSRCLNCDKEMSYLPSQGPGKYCSRRCIDEHKSRKAACERCGGVYIKLSSSRRFCSLECSRAALPHPSLVDGRSKHPHYTRWYNMMVRCTRPEHPMYRLYGARGISVCEEWETPAEFYRYLDEELGPCPAGHSIDRIDNDGDYEPGNLRWATQLEQVRNSRRHLK